MESGGCHVDTAKSPPMGREYLTYLFEFLLFHTITGESCGETYTLRRVGTRPLMRRWGTPCDSPTSREGPSVRKWWYGCPHGPQGFPRLGLRRQVLFGRRGAQVEDLTRCRVLPRVVDTRLLYVRVPRREAVWGRTGG